MGTTDSLAWSGLLLELACLFTMLGAPRVLWGHDPGLSSAILRVTGGRLEAQLTFARGDVQPLLVDSRLDALAKGCLEILVEGHPIAPDRVRHQSDASHAVLFELSFPLEGGKEVLARSVLIDRLPWGHRQYVKVEGPGGAVVIERMLDADNPDVAFTAAAAGGGPEAVSAAGAPHGARSFFLLGVEHIATGYDHLLFLLAVVIAGRGFLDAAKVITSFTVAHSITLACATLGLIRIPPSVIEPLIALSIVWVGVENLSRKNISRRWMLTFAFGLVHGFGFASVLEDMGIASSPGGAALPLLAFNLGVEAGQIAAAAAVLPLLAGIRRSPQVWARFAPACSAIVAAAGLYWLVERTL